MLRAGQSRSNRRVGEVLTGAKFGTTTWRELTGVLRQAFDPAIYGHVGKPWDRLNRHDRILIIRKYGGLGDVIASSIVIQEVLARFPENHVTYCLPSKYHTLFQGIKNLTLVDAGKYLRPHACYKGGLVKPELLHNFQVVEDISASCHVHEQIFTHFGFDRKGVMRWRNRSDIWATWIGLAITAGRSCISTSQRQVSEARVRYYPKGANKTCAVCPTSANAIKDWRNYHNVAEALRKAGWGVTMFSDRIRGAVRCSGAMDFLLAIEAADLVITVDSAALHAAGVRNVSAYSLFSINDGPAYCKYYPTVTPLQLCDTPCILFGTNVCQQRKQLGDCYGFRSVGVIINKLEEDGLL